MVFLLLFGLLLTFLKCNAREINIAGLITTHTQFDTQQNLEILIFEGLPDNKASYAVCDVFPTEARLITSGDVYYCIDYGVRDVNSDDITIDFMNGINLPFHISWEARKALYDSGDVNFTYEFKFSEFESLTSYDLQFRQYNGTNWSDALQIRRKDIQYRSFGYDIYRCLWAVPSQKDVVVNVP